MENGRLKVASVRGSARRILVLLALMFVLVEAGLFLFQRSLLYHPVTQTMSQLLKDCDSEELTLWPSPNDYRGLMAQPRAQVIRGTVLLLHGNAGSAIDRTEYGNLLLPLGYRLILLEYPGFGARPGRPSEAVLTADAAESVRLAHAQFGEPLFLFGESLGTGVAASTIAVSGRQINGVLLGTPWDSLPRVAQSLFWFLPVKWLMRDRFDTSRNLAGYPGPLAIVMAGQDELIPNECTLALDRSFTGKKQLTVLKQATHNDWVDWTDRKWWDQTMRFLRNE